MPRTVFSDLANALTTFRNKAPVPYVAAGRSRGLLLPSATPAGMESQMRAVGSVGTLFAIVNRLIEAYSQVEWHLYKSASSGKKEDREEVTDHPALTLWQSPNPFMTGPQFREATQQHEELTGEQWWVVAPHERLNIPGELWPVRPDRMEPVPNVEEFLTGYEYRAPGGARIELGRDEVVFLRRPNPLDPYRGMGAVQTILSDLEGSRLAAEWVRNFFYNNAAPGGVIEVDHNLDDPDWDRFQARWQESHRGVANAHRVAMLEKGMKWVDRRFTVQELEIESLRNVPRELIREAFGFPKPMLGTVDDVNRANAEAADTMMARWLSRPRLERTKQALNTRLLPMYKSLGRGYEFDYDNPVPEDRELASKELTAKTAAARVCVDMGFEPKSVAVALGLPEMEVVAAAGGEGLATPQQLGEMIQSIYLGVDTVITWPEARAILNRAGAGLDLSVQPPATIRRYSRGGQQQPAVEPAGPEGEPQAVLRVEAMRLPRWALTAAADDGKEALDAVRQEFDDALESLEGEWAPVEDAWVKTLGDAVEAAVDDEDVSALGSLSVDSAEGASVLRGALASMAEAAADRMVAEAADQGVEVGRPELEMTARAAGYRGVRAAYGSELVDVAVATAALLGSELARSAAVEALRLYTPGAVGRDVAGKVKNFLRELKGRFRKDQLGGALHRAQNAGRIAVLEEAPTARYIAEERGDRNSCDPCKDIDGTEFDDIGAVRAAYGTGGYVNCEGGIRCRGTVRAVWE